MRKKVKCGKNTNKWKMHLLTRFNESSEWSHTLRIVFFFSSQESSRKISLSYKPFLTSQPSASRRYSTVSNNDSRSQTSSQNNLDSLQENDHDSSISLSNQATSIDNNNLNTIGTKIVATQPNKLPQIRLTGPDTKPEKNKKKRKKKKSVEKELSVSEPPRELPSVVVQDSGVGTLPIEGNNSNENNEDDGINWKYRLEAQYFQMGKFFA